MNELDDVMEAMQRLIEDHAIPKNIKAKLMSISDILTSPEEQSIKVNKALDELEEVQGDTNLQAFTRTQLWELSSLLEAVISGPSH